jgi:hypothetical protein
MIKLSHARSGKDISPELTIEPAVLNNTIGPRSKAAP